MGRGGKRVGAGRPKGARNKATLEREQRSTEILERAKQAGLTPLEYLLERMRDPEEDKKVRLLCAKEAAPYIHPRLASIQHGGQLDLRNVTDGDLAAEFESLARAAGLAVAGSGARQSPAPGAGAKKPH
jgi:hypothetical protein